MRTAIDHGLTFPPRPTRLVTQSHDKGETQVITGDTKTDSPRHNITWEYKTKSPHYKSNPKYRKLYQLN